MNLRKLQESRKNETVECEVTDCKHNIAGKYCKLKNPDANPCFCLDYEEKKIAGKK